MAGGIIGYNVEDYPIDYSQFEQPWRGVIQSPQVAIPESKEITTTTLFAEPREFTKGSFVVFPIETVNTSSEEIFLNATETEHAIIRLVDIAWIQYQGTWNDPGIIFFRVERNGIDVLNIVRYLRAGAAGSLEPGGETVILQNFIMQKGDIVYLKYTRNVTAASFNAHIHLHGTLLPE